MSELLVRNVTKTYGETMALNDVTIQLRENTIYGLLGRSGAGKTTLMSLMSNRIRPTSGWVFLNQEPLWENDRVLSQLYCTSEVNYYPPEMTVKKVFQWSRRFYPSFDLKYAYRLAELFRLDAAKRCGALSTGYSCILKDIVALACKTPIVLLDEPVLGLDASHREPRTVVLSTHLIEEVQDLLEEVIIIHHGAILVQDSMEHLARLGYAVTGREEQINLLLADEEIRALGSEALGGRKTVYVLEKPELDLFPDVTVEKLDVQKLFIEITKEPK